MSQDTTRRGLLGGVAATVAASIAGCSSLTPFVGQRLEETERIATESADRLVVEGSVVDVDVATADRDDVHADVVKESSSTSVNLSNLHLRTDRTDGRLVLSTEWTGDDPLLAGEPAMELDLTVPRSLAVERIEANTGDVSVADAAGELTVDVSTGDIAVERFDGDVAVDTSTGRVNVTDVEGDVAVDTSIGRVDVSDVDGDVDADTNTGRVEVTDVAGTVGADTSTGGVRVLGAGGIDTVSTNTGGVVLEVRGLTGDATVSTTTGSVDVALPAALDAEVRVTTSTGDISVEGLGFDDETRTDDTLVGTLGDGGRTLRIDTTTGDVSLSAVDESAVQVPSSE